MIFRFSLYGFLKNQRYFEAFLYLAFLEKGLDFFQIGLLVAARSIAVNLCEVPSGAIADVFGRRRLMLLSLSSYIAGFVALGAADHVAALAAGMALLGFGDAFRSGTHKAMVFAWLAAQDRTDERVRVYGYTRSWSKFGSAASVVAGAVIVLVSDTYSWVFYATVVPYVAGLVNLLGYPAALDGEAAASPSLGRAVRHMAEAVGAAVRRSSLRRLVLEAMGFDGVFAAVKDYLQPVLEAAAIAAAAGLLAAGGDLSDTQRTALLVGPVYVILFLLSGVASRRSHAVSDAAGGEDRAARVLWGAVGLVFAVMLAAGWAGASAPLVVTFVALHVLHNLWRPILISRFDVHGDESHGASILSLESQAQRLAVLARRRRRPPVRAGLPRDGAAGPAPGSAIRPRGRRLSLPPPPPRRSRAAPGAKRRHRARISAETVLFGSHPAADLRLECWRPREARAEVGVDPLPAQQRRMHP
jgi:MFS family permease